MNHEIAKYCTQLVDKKNIKGKIIGEGPCGLAGCNVCGLCHDHCLTHDLLPSLEPGLFILNRTYVGRAAYGAVVAARRAARS